MWHTQISQKIISCKACPRLVPYIRQVAAEKVRRFRNEDYWGRPVPGFGDPMARMLIIGLAPAAHGANRTGRMFTGDSSGDWLYRALHETGFANRPGSTHRDDGLILTDAYITAIVRCAPPQNKPTPEEISTCARYLEAEWQAMQGHLRVVVCLGKLAFDQYCRIRGLKGYVFGHRFLYRLQDGTFLLASYHPSRQNTQTGKLKWDDWVAVFGKARGLLNSL